MDYKANDPQEEDFLLMKELNPPSLSLSGMSSGTKPRHVKKSSFFGQSYINSWRLMNGMGKSRCRLTKVAPIAACSQWNRLNTCSLVVHSLNMDGGMLLTSFGNSLPKGGTLAKGNHFP